MHNRIIDADQARAIATQSLEADGMVLTDAFEEERHFGWAFSFVSRGYAETGDPNQLIPGPSALVVHRDGSACYIGGGPPQLAIDAYASAYPR